MRSDPNLAAYSVMCRHDRENFAEKRVARVAEEACLALRQGVENSVDTRTFRALVAYLFDEKRPKERAHRTGRFTIGNITVVRDGKSRVPSTAKTKEAA